MQINFQNFILSPRKHKSTPCEAKTVPAKCLPAKMEIPKLKMYKSIFTSSPSPRENMNLLPTKLIKAKTDPAKCLPAKTEIKKTQNVPIHFYNFTLSPRKHKSTPCKTYQGRQKLSPQSVSPQKWKSKKFKMYQSIFTTSPSPHEKIN